MEKSPAPVRGRSKRRNSPSVPKPLTARKLIRATLREFATGWKTYCLVVGLIAVPVDILSAVFSLSTSDVSYAYFSLASYISVVALIWAITRRHMTGRASTLREAYYDGSVAVVRYFLVSLVLIVLLVPAAFGAALYGIGLTASSSTGSYSPVLMLIALVCFVIAIPSGVLLIRFGLAPFVAVQDGLPPFEALRIARTYTMGRFWPLVGRYIVLGLALLGMLVPIIIATIVLSLLHLGAVATPVFEIASTLLILPMANIYMYRLFLSISENSRTAQQAEDLQASEELESGEDLHPAQLTQTPDEPAPEAEPAA
jgi:hypothetical protein